MAIRAARKWLVVGVIILLICGTAITLFFVNTKPEAAEVWLTTGNEQHLLEQQPAIEFADNAIEHNFKIEVNSDERFQKMQGFGMAVTGSSAYLVNKQMSGDQREALLDDLFTKTGINLNFIRHSIGASDYSVDSEGNPMSYTYDDVEEGTDYNLENFSIEHDADVIRLIKDVLAVNEEAKVMGSPWTAPPWMKIEKTYNGSYLNFRDPRIYNTYANYFVKYIKAYEAEGIPIHGVMVQNEPEFTSPNYPTMSMNAQEQAMFIGEYLGPAFIENGISTQIVAFDHNWDTGLAYAQGVHGNEKATVYSDATAFHCYQGTPDAMTDVHEAFPEKHIYFTECSAGAWSTDFGDNLSWIMSYLMVGAPRNWAETVQLWNMALDPAFGPQNGGCPDCTGVITINPENGEITKNMEYYALGHLSKFVDPGAIRIGSTQYKGNVETVAFENPDGTTVLLAANTSEAPKTFSVHAEGRAFDYNLPAQSAVTFTWAG